MSHLFYPNEPTARPAKLPVTIYAPRTPDQPIDLWYETAIACEPWNALAPVFNLTDKRDAQVWGVVMFGDETWVRWKRPNYSSVPIVYVQRKLMIGSREATQAEYLNYVRYWLPHELGHLIGLADHINPNTPTSGYQNPTIADAADHYNGVMSYRTPRWEWFGDDDRDMLQRWWGKKDVS